MIPTEGWDFLRDAGEDRRFCCLMLHSTGANHVLGRNWPRLLLPSKPKYSC